MTRDIFSHLFLYVFDKGKCEIQGKLFSCIYIAHASILDSICIILCSVTVFFKFLRVNEERGKAERNPDKPC